jgi:ADP-ribosylglycohydrolase
MTLAIVRAICRAGKVDGAEIAAEFVRLWNTGEIVGAGASCSEGVYNIYERGMKWSEAGTPIGRAGNGAAMRAAPIGLWNCLHPDRIPHDAEISSIVTHKDPRSIAGAIAVAEGVRLNLAVESLDPADYLKKISAAVRPASTVFSRYLDLLGRWITLEPDEALRLIYASGEPEVGPRQPRGISGYVIPSVLCSLFFFLKTPRDFLATVIGAIRAGGDTDTTAAIAGAISGALNGIQAIPWRLVEALKDSQEILALAEEFYEAAARKGQVKD